jgi:hypothetical protein
MESRAARRLHEGVPMTIQQPPNDELPPTTPGDEQPDEVPIDSPQEPEQRAPGADEPPLGAPRDEPDPDMA